MCVECLGDGETYGSWVTYLQVPRRLQWREWGDFVFSGMRYPVPWDSTRRNCDFFSLLWSREHEVNKSFPATVWHCQIFVGFWISAVICPPASCLQPLPLSRSSPPLPDQHRKQKIPLWTWTMDVMCVNGRKNGHELPCLSLVTNRLWSMEYHWGEQWTNEHIGI